MWYHAKSLQSRALKGAATSSYRTLDSSYSLPWQIHACRVLFRCSCRIFYPIILWDHVGLWKVRSEYFLWVLTFLWFCFCSSQRRCQTVVSLSVLPDTLVTEHQWVYSISNAVTSGAETAKALFHWRSFTAGSRLQRSLAPLCLFPRTGSGSEKLVPE